MSVAIQRTEKELVIRLPLTSLPEDIEAALSYFRYIELGQKN